MYTYDALNRLATAGATSSSWGQSYTYDGFGNLLDQTVTAGTAPSLSVTYNAANNLQTTDCADANGNITGSVTGGSCSTGQLYTYDAKNRIAEATASGIYYGYAPDNKRVWRGNNSGSVNEIAFWSVTGQKLITCTLTPGGSGTTLTCPTASTFVYFGRKMLSNSTGNVVQDRLGSIGKFYPYGQEKPSATTNGTEKFTAYFRDSETSIDYAINRYRQPGMGRFLSTDLNGGSASLSNPGSWNRYTYVVGDPVNNTDRKGLTCTPFELINNPGNPQCDGDDDGDVQTCSVFFNTLSDLSNIPNCDGQGGGGGESTAPPPLCDIYVRTYGEPINGQNFAQVSTNVPLPLNNQLGEFITGGGVGIGFAVQIVTTLTGDTNPAHWTPSQQFWFYETSQVTATSPIATRSAYFSSDGPYSKANTIGNGSGLLTWLDAPQDLYFFNNYSANESFVFTSTVTYNSGGASCSLDWGFNITLSGGMASIEFWQGSEVY